MLTEFPERFQRLLAGPMWSGLDAQDMKDPTKVKQIDDFWCLFIIFRLLQFDIKGIYK